MDGEVTLLSRQRDHWNSRHRVLIDLQGEAIEEAATSPATLLPLQRWIEKVVEKEGGRIITRYPHEQERNGFVLPPKVCCPSRSRGRQMLSDDFASAYKVYTVHVSLADRVTA